LMDEDKAVHSQKAGNLFPRKRGKLSAQATETLCTPTNSDNPAGDPPASSA
jgi:hypothetical protein